MLDRYVNFVRVAYLTLWDNNTRSLLSSRNPAKNAGTMIFGCLFGQVAALELLAIAITGGISGLSQGEILAFFAVPMVLVIVWEIIYVERSDTLRELWARLEAESDDAKARRLRAVSWFRIASFAAWLIGFVAVLVRISLEHRGLLVHR
jgi:hypothetical protein